MDPNSCFNEIVNLANRLQYVNEVDYKGILYYENEEDVERDTLRLSELILSLDSWLSKSGFLPDKWKSNSR